MSNHLSYKGYTGSVEISQADKCLYGKVQFIKSLLSYEGESYSELLEDFKGVIDEYLSDCNANGIEAERPFKGSFNIRISPLLHRNLAIKAQSRGQSLNKYVSGILESAL